MQVAGIVPEKDSSRLYEFAYLSSSDDADRTKAFGRHSLKSATVELTDLLEPIEYRSGENLASPKIATGIEEAFQTLMEAMEFKTAVLKHMEDEDSFRRTAEYMLMEGLVTSDSFHIPSKTEKSLLEMPENVKIIRKAADFLVSNAESIISEEREKIRQLVKQADSVS